MKKQVRRALAVALVIGMLTTTVSAAVFPDIQPSDACAEAAEYLSALGIMVGDEKGNFNPDKPVTRAEMATIICRMLDEMENTQGTTHRFSDVSKSHWASNSIAWAAENGIIQGYNGKFSPSAAVNYEDAVTMVVRALGGEAEAQEAGGYPDGYLEVAKRYNLLENVSGSIKRSLTRSNIAVLIYNCLSDNDVVTTPSSESINYAQAVLKSDGNLDNLFENAATVLEVPWDLINKCGHQVVSGPCQAYAFAYCRTILDNKLHKYTEYWIASEGKATAPSVAKYESMGYSGAKTITGLLKIVCENIDMGRPMVLRVKGTYSIYHYVVAIGYKNTINRQNPKESDILILDPANKSITPDAGSNETYTYLNSRKLAPAGNQNLYGGFWTKAGAASVNKVDEFNNTGSTSTSIVFHELTTPSNLKQGSSAHIDGAFVSSYSPITSVKAEVINSSGKVCLSAVSSGFSNQTYGPLKNSKLDKDLKFGTLPAGIYYIKYTVVTADGTTAAEKTDTFRVLEDVCTDHTYQNGFCTNCGKQLEEDKDTGSSAAGTCGADLTWELRDDGTLCIYGSGEMDNFSNWGGAWNPVPWSEHKDRITEIELPRGLTSIGDSAFAYHTNITEAHIPEGVTTLGESAFIGCEGLSEIHIPTSVTRIKDYCFAGCNDTLEYIYYGGTRSEWDAIRKGSYQSFDDATIICEGGDDNCNHAERKYSYHDDSHPHYDYYTCMDCSEVFTDGSTSVSVIGCSHCGYWGSWSSWGTKSYDESVTRQVQTRTSQSADGYTEYRYGRYVANGHDCWCAKYLEGLGYGRPSLDYSAWSTTRYSTTSSGWTCGQCSADHIGVSKVWPAGISWWGEYKSSDGESYYWEESRTVPAAQETQYRYRDWIMY